MIGDPYTLIDANGHEIFVLASTYTVITDIGRGDLVEFGTTTDYELADAWRECLRLQGVAADITVEQETIDLTEAYYEAALAVAAEMGRAAQERRKP